MENIQTIKAELEEKQYKATKDNIQVAILDIFSEVWLSSLCSG